MSPPLLSHYDTLNVTPSAPVEVIKASYRALSQKYHPDRNPDPDALHLMTLINQAWDVLSDPERRAHHDRALAQAAAAAAQATAATAPRAQARPDSPGEAATLPRHWIGQHKWALALAIAVMTGMLYVSRTYDRVSLSAVQRAQDEELATGSAVADRSWQQVWTERPWEAVPAERPPHGYLKQEPQVFSGGLSSVELDNRAGDRDAEVRLYRNGRSVRSVFVHRGASFLVEQLAPGTYSMKYKVVVDGKMHAYQANEALQLSQGSDEEAAGRAIRLQRTILTVAGGAHEVPLDQI